MDCRDTRHVKSVAEPAAVDKLRVDKPLRKMKQTRLPIHCADQDLDGAMALPGSNYAINGES